MDKKLLSVLGALVVLLAIFAIIMFGLGTTEALGPFNFSVDQATLGMRFLFVFIGVAIAFVVYFFTKENKAWEVGTREVVYMAIGAALYAIFAYLFNGTVFVVPSLSQVALRPAIAIPMFFGYAFGPVVGFFSGAVGNMFGDALTGFGLSPQWSIGNGLVGFVAGLWMLFSNKKKSMDTVLYVGGALALLTVVLFFLNRTQANMLFYDVENNVFGDAQISIFAGISILIGFVLVLAVSSRNYFLAHSLFWENSSSGFTCMAHWRLAISALKPAILILSVSQPMPFPMTKSRRSRLCTPGCGMWMRIGLTSWKAATSQNRICAATTRRAAPIRVSTKTGFTWPGTKATGFCSATAGQPRPAGGWPLPGLRRVDHVPDAVHAGDWRYCLETGFGALAKRKLRGVVKPGRLGAGLAEESAKQAG